MRATARLRREEIAVVECPDVLSDFAENRMSQVGKGGPIAFIGLTDHDIELAAPYLEVIHQRIKFR